VIAGLDSRLSTSLLCFICFLSFSIFSVFRLHLAISLPLAFIGTLSVLLPLSPRRSFYFVFVVFGVSLCFIPDGFSEPISLPDIEDVCHRTDRRTNNLRTV
jgi:hypothetical protein